MITEHYPNVYLYRRIVQAKLFIDMHYSDKIDLDNISGEAYFSKFHFIRLFKSIYGKTPHQYLTYVRIEKAKEFLKQGNSVTQVCFLVGFESVSSFSGLFSKNVGATPSVYFMQHVHTQKKIGQHPLSFIPGCYAYQHGWTKNSNIEEVTD